VGALPATTRVATNLHAIFVPLLACVSGRTPGHTFWSWASQFMVMDSGVVRSKQSPHRRTQWHRSQTRTMLLADDSVAEFRDKGYLVVPDVVPIDLCRRVVDLIARHCSIEAATGLPLGEDPAAPQSGHGIVPIHHGQALWDVRQHPHVHRVFSSLYGREDLWVTMDRVSCKPPGLGDAWHLEPLHWDCDPWQFDGMSIQGLVCLTDTTQIQGAFCCVPDIYRNLASYLDAHAGHADRRRPLAEPDDIKSIGGPAGSLILWNRLMPHSSGVNLSNDPRYVQYLAMQPVGDQQARDQRVREWRQCLPPDWAIKQQVPSQKIPEPGLPADLTILGRKLVGVDDWG
jgi:hypothetical protein